MKEIDYAQYRTDTFRYYSQQFAPIRAMKADDTTERLYTPGAGCSKPSTSGFSEPDAQHLSDNISTNLIVPLSQEKTLTIFEWFFHDIATEENQQRIKRSVAFSDEVQQEDIGLCEASSVVLRSSTYDRGRYFRQARKWRSPFPHAAWRISWPGLTASSAKGNRDRHHHGHNRCRQNHHRHHARHSAQLAIRRR